MESRLLRYITVHHATSRHIAKTMPRLPASTLPRFARTSTIPRTAFAQRSLQTNQKPGAETVEGASGKDTKHAQPKILNVSPPKEEDLPEDVKEHNRDVARRVEKPADQIGDQRSDKDKVDKEFWAGRCYS